MTPHLSEAPEAYLRHVRAITGVSQESLRDIWEPDGVVEFPYAANVGRTTRLDGIGAIEEYFGGLELFEGFGFSGWRVGRLVARDEWVIEVHGSSRLKDGGGEYHQDYIVLLGVSPRGRLSWLREYWDPTRF